MEISVEVTEEQDCRRVLSVEVAPGHLQEEKEQVVGSLAKEVSVPGFRKGKAPRDIIKSRYADHIEQEALKAFLPKVYQQAIQSKNLAPISQPVFSDIQGKEGEPLRLRIEIEVAPEIELSGYKGVKVKKEKVKIGDDDVTEVLNNLQERSAEFEPVDRGAVTNDMVVIDYAPIGLDGKPDEEKRVTDFPVQLGTGQIFPAFEEQIKNKPAGARGTTVIEYPHDYEPEHLAGTKVEYEFTVKEVREKRVPPLDDEFAKKMDEKFSTLGDLKKDIKKRMQEEKEKEARRKAEEGAIDKLIERNPFDIPRSMLERFKNELGEEDKRRREAMGAPSEQDEERLKQMDGLFENIARRNIKRFFILDHIAGLEKVEVTDEDIDKEFETIVEESGRPIEDVKKVYHRGSDSLSGLKNRIRERKLFEIILG
jgi:trigger factor